ncbi:MAG TPA: CusA/CzcA family heavy metal efflux RND transporter [Rhodobiaceae bacterium]|nr:CusA/CzcA family heavy metal efflux RND transporter [Rhodobiaceae bacterium]
MLNSIIDLGIRGRLLVVLSLAAAIVGSVLVLPNLNLDAFPDVTNVQVSINTEARGLASEEVEQLITYPIEAVMYALPDVQEVRSISKTGLSVITVVFQEGTDIYFARQLVFERLQAAMDQIPDGVGTPEMGPNTSGLGQIFQYVLRAEEPGKFDIKTLRSLNDWVVKLLLMPVDGVTDVLSFGGDVLQYQVNIDPQKLLSFGLAVDDVREAIEASNRNSGGWYLDRGAEQLVIRGVGWVRSGDDGLRDIGNVPLKEEDGFVVRIADVADVSLGGEIRQGATTLTIRDADGRPQQLGEVVLGVVLKRLGANTKVAIDSIKDRLETVALALPDGVVLEPIYDQADLVDQAVSTVSRALIEAFLLIVVILALFLMNLRATVLVLISVPISIGLALMAMSIWGVSANLMSLGGLAIAIGMMVDGSVVMMENIFSHLTKPADDAGADETAASVGDQPHGLQLRIQEAAREMGRPVFYAVLIIIVVFAPLFSLEGVEGKLFQPMAVSIVLAMLASLFVALIVVPALSTYMFRGGVKHRESPILRPLENWYKGTLNGALQSQKKVVSGAVVLLVVSLLAVPFLGTEFVPELEEGTINLRVTLAPSSSLETSTSVAEKLEKMILEFPEVIYASSRVGRPELGGDPEPVSNVEIYVGLKPVSEWVSATNRFELQRLMEEKLAVHPGLLFSFSQPIATRVDELLSGVKAQLAVKLFGADLDVLAEKGREIETLVRNTQGTRDVAMEQIAGEAQLVVRPDRDKLARFGLSVDAVMDLVSAAIGGREAGQVIQGNERYDIYVRLADQFRASPEAIRDLILESPRGAWVRLDEVASVEIEAGPPQIRRDDVQRRIVIQTNVEGRDMGGLVTELRDRIAQEVALPTGYTVVFGGQFENQARAQARLMIVVPLSLALIFLLLYFAFGSVGQAALIMVNVPLALIGGIFSLLLTGQYLSVPGSIGFIALFGVAVLNGVVMVSAINQNVLGGQAVDAAVFSGAVSRLRPVLMTASIAALGLIPMLLSSGVGSEVQRPLATVVVGGLISSTALTLFILPTLYRTFSQAKLTEWQHTHQGARAPLIQGASL